MSVSGSSGANKPRQARALPALPKTARASKFLTKGTGAKLSFDDAMKQARDALPKFRGGKIKEGFKALWAGFKSIMSRASESVKSGVSRASAKISSFGSTKETPLLSRQAEQRPADISERRQVAGPPKASRKGKVAPATTQEAIASQATQTAGDKGDVDKMNKKEQVVHYLLNQCGDDPKLHADVAMLAQAVTEFDFEFKMAPKLEGRKGDRPHDEVVKENIAKLSDFENRIDESITALGLCSDDFDDNPNEQMDGLKRSVQSLATAFEGVDEGIATLANETLAKLGK